MDDPLPSRAIPPPRLMASLCSSRAFCTFSSASSRRCIPTSDDLREARMDGTWKMAIENGYMMGYYVCTMVYIIIYILWGMYIHIYIDIMGCVYTYIYYGVCIYIWNTYYYIPYNIYIYTGYIPYIWWRHTLWRNWTYPPQKKNGGWSQKSLEVNYVHWIATFDYQRVSKTRMLRCVYFGDGYPQVMAMKQIGGVPRSKAEGSPLNRQGKGSEFMGFSDVLRTSGCILRTFKFGIISDYPLVI